MDPINVLVGVEIFKTKVSQASFQRILGQETTEWIFYILFYVVQKETLILIKGMLECSEDIQPNLHISKWDLHDSNPAVDACIGRS